MCSSDSSHSSLSSVCEDLMKKSMRCVFRWAYLLPEYGPWKCVCVCGGGGGRGVPGQPVYRGAERMVSHGRHKLIIHVHFRLGSSRRPPPLYTVSWWRLLIILSIWWWRRWWCVSTGEFYSQMQPLFGESPISYSQQLPTYLILPPPPPST